MALADSTKVKIVRYLGYAVQVINPDSLHYNSQISDYLSGLTSFAEAAVLDIVKRIEKIDERLECALDRLSAKKVDEITLRDDEIERIRRERSRLVKELGRSLDIRPQTAGNMMVGVCV